MWNEEKIKKLNKLYPTISNIILSDLLGISKGYIIKKANDLSLYKDKSFMKSLKKKNNPV